MTGPPAQDGARPSSLDLPPTRLPTARVSLRSFAPLVRDTVRAERAQYRSNPRPLSARRLWRAAWPDLRHPIFVIGAPRSGTTFLGSCLAAVPGISYHNEPSLTQAAVMNVWSRHWRRSTAEAFFRCTYAWLLRIHLDGDLRFAEKTPRNCHIVPFLATAFPGAQFLHLVRDGRAVALSHRKRPWMRNVAATGVPGTKPPAPVPFWIEPGREDEYLATTDLHRCIWGWRVRVEAVLEAASELPGDRLLQVTYEDLVTNPATEERRLLAFLGMDTPECTERFDAALAAGRLDSIDRWRRELADDEIADLENEAGPVLERLGYQRWRRDA